MKQNSFLRRCLRMLMAVLVFSSLSPTSLRAAEDWSYKPVIGNPNASGSGNYNDPYRIETAQQLVNLAYEVTQEGMSYAGSYFRLMNDIVLNDDVIAGAIKEADGSIRYDKNKAHFDKMKAWQPISLFPILRPRLVLETWDVWLDMPNQERLPTVMSKTASSAVILMFMVMVGMLVDL